MAVECRVQPLCDSPPSPTVQDAILISILILNLINPTPPLLSTDPAYQIRPKPSSPFPFFSPTQTDRTGPSATEIRNRCGIFVSPPHSPGRHQEGVPETPGPHHGARHLQSGRFHFLRILVPLLRVYGKKGFEPPTIVSSDFNGKWNLCFYPAEHCHPFPQKNTITHTLFPDSFWDQTPFILNFLIIYLVLIYYLYFLYFILFYFI